jgi:hypothetical protein
LTLEPAPIVWGGQLRDPEVLREKVLDNEYASGEAVISVRWATPEDGERLEDYLLRVTSEGRVVHGSIQLTTPQQIAEAGLGLVEDSSEGQPPHHYHVVFPQPVALSDAEAFIRAFSEPQPNPAKKK